MKPGDLVRVQCVYRKAGFDHERACVIEGQWVLTQTHYLSGPAGSPPVAPTLDFHHGLVCGKYCNDSRRGWAWVEFFEGVAEVPTRLIRKGWGKLGRPTTHQEASR